MDFLLVAAALYPPEAYIRSEQALSGKAGNPLVLEGMHVISKKMFCPDIQTIKNIIKAKKAAML